MANYIFTNAVVDQSPSDIWRILVSTLNVGDKFYSIGDPPKIYVIATVTDEVISYKGDDRSGGIPEDIDKTSFDVIVDGLKKMVMFNTNSSKQLFNKAKIYKKRSPMFALLLTNEIIMRKNKSV